MNNKSNEINWEDWDDEEINEKIIDLNNKINLSFDNFQVNDRVKFIYKNISYYATIIYYGDYIIFEFDDFINGHNGVYDDGTISSVNGKKGYCWIYMVEDINNKENINWLKKRLTIKSLFNQLINIV